MAASECGRATSAVVVGPLATDVLVDAVELVVESSFVSEPPPHDATKATAATASTAAVIRLTMPQVWTRSPRDTKAPPRRTGTLTRCPCDS